MFLAELGAGEIADSRALQADALDFFGDAANYAISLGVAGMALAWRARAALIKGITLTALGGYVIVGALLAALDASSPQPEIMGGVGIAALAAYVGVALMLYRFREGDANMRSVWICSRMTPSPMLQSLPPPLACLAPAPLGPTSSSPRLWLLSVSLGAGRSFSWPGVS